MASPADGPDHGRRANTLADLRERFVSGLILGVVALAMLVASPLTLAVLATLIAAVMSWEWGGLVRDNGFDAAGVTHIVIALAAGALATMGSTGYAIAIAMAGAILVALLAARSKTIALSALGVLYTCLPIIALIWLRRDELGLAATLFVLLVVIATDTGAYFTGRAIGGPKLWPAVSPKKTWSGLIGGVTAAMLVAAIFPLVSATGYWPWLIPLGAILALTGQGGDLAESALKRHFSRKDASNLIPGHGGFMDRMDGVVAAGAVAAVIAFAIDAYAPARALLYGS